MESMIRISHTSKKSISRFFCRCFFNSFVILLLFVGNIFSENKAALSTADITSLEVLLNDASSEMVDNTRDPRWRKFEEAILNGRDHTLSILQRHLSDESNEYERSLAAYGIALIGSNRACEILRIEYQRTREVELKSLCYFCMASAATPDHIQFLMDGIKEETLDDSGELEGDPETAALSLGVIGEKKAIPELKKIANREEGSIDSRTAAEVLTWLKHDGVQLENLPPNAAERETIILTVLNCCSLGSQYGKAFYEEETQYKWYIKNNSWAFNRSVLTEVTKLSRISFELVLSGDNRDCILHLDIMAGPLAGKGYLYRLRKESNTWKVIGILRTAIS